MQELVLIRNAPAIGINGGVRTVLDANGVDGGSAILERLGGGDGGVGTDSLNPLLLVGVPSVKKTTTFFAPGRASFSAFCAWLIP